MKRLNVGEVEGFQSLVRLSEVESSEWDDVIELPFHGIIVEGQ